MSLDRLNQFVIWGFGICFAGAMTMIVAGLLPVLDGRRMWAVYLLGPPTLVGMAMLLFGRFAKPHPPQSN